MFAPRLALAASVFLAEAAAFSVQTPPMGWNSYDSFLEGITEPQFLGNAEVLSTLQPHGWQYAVIDAGWYTNMAGTSVSTDGFSRVIPDPVRYPSSKAAGGFKPLAAFVHSMGLRFGVHVMRGIHKQAVLNNEPIYGTNYTARDVAVESDSCDWWSDWYGINMTHPAGPAYYDSIVELYADWGLDFIKVDCIFGGRDGHPADIKAVSGAITRFAAPMALSLSPGLGATPEMGAELGPYVNSYRVTNDLWDCWSNSSTNAPCPYDYVTVVGAFATMPYFNTLVGAPGLNGRSFPDFDMLPLGVIMPPGTNTQRPTGLTQDEQRSLFTLWCIFQNPLMFGGDLTQLDNFTLSLITNDEVIAVNQDASGMPTMWLATSPANGVYGWSSPASEDATYIALFNTGDQSATYAWSFETAGAPCTRCAVRDLWTQTDLGVFETSFKSRLNVHGTSLYKVSSV